MTKHALLTETEFRQYKPQARAVEQLYAFLAVRNCAEKDIRVLDWGCGRGRFVLWLREKGFNAFGVDIDPEPEAMGLPLFREHGFKDTPLTLLDENGHTVYPDGHFDFIFTDNVLEHVSDFAEVVDEVARITTAGGAGYHIFPARRQLREGHLFMPLVHWLPAGGLRRLGIWKCVLLGIEPKWEELNGRSIREKVETYYNYSVNHLFYRPVKVVKAGFEKRGFKVTFLALQHPALKKNPFTRVLLKVGSTRSLLEWVLLTFKQVELVARKS